MNKNLKLLVDMLTLQFTLNSHTCGAEWKQGTTNKGRTIEWRRYLRMEMCELIDSSDKFKHWKNLDGVVDYDNIRMETVDGWHFLMSEAITHCHNDTIVEMCERYLVTEPFVTEVPEYFNIINCADDMIKCTYDDDENSISRMFYYFFKLLAATGMTYQDLYKQYVVKNTLNTFRQNNGYKEGTYIKKFDGAEDNVHMMNLATDNPELTPDELYSLFETYYKNMYI